MMVLLKSFLKLPRRCGLLPSSWYHYHSCSSFLVSPKTTITTRRTRSPSQQAHIIQRIKALPTLTSVSKYSTCSGNNSSSDGRDFLRLTDEHLMSQCEMGTFKASGPGGQHRNKRESAVRLKHLPTGILAQAVEDRSQHKNRASALARLRTLLALKGTMLILIRIRLLKSFFKFFPQNQPSEDQIVVHKLDRIIQNLLWECKLCWI